MVLEKPKGGISIDCFQNLDHTTLTQWNPAISNSNGFISKAKQTEHQQIIQLHTRKKQFAL